MPELRQNIITREWVIIATERAKRPDQFSRKREEVPVLPERDSSCPFCPGNEESTPPEIYRVGDERCAVWKVRVVENKFPALVPSVEPWRKIEGIKRSMNGIGKHEVVIETPIHNTTLALLSLKEIELVLNTYRMRYIELAKNKYAPMIIIFRNHGEMAGTSLVHPHSQIIATPVVPAQIRYRMEIAMQYFDDTGECIGCHMMKEEMKVKERIICENEHFVSFVPYAALSPFHTWIFPKRHFSSFGNIREDEVKSLAKMLKTVLLKLYRGLNNPDYNYCIRSAPCDEGELDYFHWYLTIVPRLTKTAGFELGSGMFINVSIPENDASFLRNVEVEVE